MQNLKIQMRQGDRQMSKLDSEWQQRLEEESFHSFTLLTSHFPLLQTLWGGPPHSAKVQILWELPQFT